MNNQHFCFDKQLLLLFVFFLSLGCFTSAKPFQGSAPSTHLAVKVGEGANDLADAQDEERGEGWGHHELVQRGHQLFLDLQAQLGRIEEGVGEVVARAEHQSLGLGRGAVLELERSILQDPYHGRRLLHTHGGEGGHGGLPVAQNHLVGGTGREVDRIPGISPPI